MQQLHVCMTTSNAALKTCLVRRLDSPKKHGNMTVPTKSHKDTWGNRKTQKIVHAASLINSHMPNETFQVAKQRQYFSNPNSSWCKPSKWSIIMTKMCRSYGRTNSKPCMQFLIMNPHMYMTFPNLIVGPCVVPTVPNIEATVCAHASFSCINICM